LIAYQLDIIGTVKAPSLHKFIGRYTLSSPPTTAIRKCPYCGDLFGTYNNDGFIHIQQGMSWTDGDQSDDINLVDDLFKCGICLETFYIDTAEIVGLDNLDEEVKNGIISGYMSVEDRFSYLKIPSLRGYKGSTIKHKHYNAFYLPLKGLPPDYHDCNSGVRVDYSEALDKGLYTTFIQELEIRLRVWWTEKYYFTDDLRRAACKPLDKCFSSDNQILRSFDLSSKAADNVCRILEIWGFVPKYNSDFLPYKIMKSDMFRQLGRFEECIYILKNSTNIDMSSRVNDGYSEIINLIVQSCSKNIKCARKSGFERSWL